MEELDELFQAIKKIRGAFKKAWEHIKDIVYNTTYTHTTHTHYHVPRDTTLPSQVPTTTPYHTPVARSCI